MDISLFDYDLPEELVAQQPTRRRDQSRLMVLDRSHGDSDFVKGVCPFKAITDYLNKGDALVINNTKVFKARLLGKRESGGQVEIFLVRKSGIGDLEYPPQAVGDQTRVRNQTKVHRIISVSKVQRRSRVDGEATGRLCRWVALAHPSRKLREGDRVHFGDRSVILERYLGEGRWIVNFGSAGNWKRIVAAHGHVPLPQYIRREDEVTDIRRYQTVYADRDKTGAVAAPTAGFHFTESVLEAVRKKGVSIVELTLHVGPGTFKPVTAEKVEDHTVDPEYAELSPIAARTINKVRERGGKIVAVGTTTVRTLESASIVNGELQSFAGMVDLYIKPGHKFRAVDHLLSNFHLPKSPLLILVSAFAGRERVLLAYKKAIENSMRFYSYGDCMLIL